jgi:hypothetical protein
MTQSNKKSKESKMTVGQVMDTEKFQEEYAKEQEQKRINKYKK